MVSIFGSLLLMPVLVGSVVSAQPAPVLECVIFFGEGSASSSQDCDLAIKKEVSVNSGPFLDANTAAEAASATVGNSVVWRISVTNPLVPDDGYIPFGIVRVSDALQPGIAFVSSTTSDGSTYDESSKVWQFNLDSSTTFPVILTINTTASATGLVENTAFLSGYACDGPDFFCEYGDTNPENNLDSAFVNISAVPVVLGETTPVVLAATGSGVLQSAVAGGLILTTLGVLGYSRFARRAL